MHTGYIVISILIITWGYAAMLGYFDWKFARKYGTVNSLAKLIRPLRYLGVGVGILLYTVLLSYTLLSTFSSLWAYVGWGLGLLVVELTLLGITDRSPKKSRSGEFMMVSLLLFTAVNGGTFAATWFLDWLNLGGWYLLWAVAAGVIGGVLSIIVAAFAIEE